MHPSDQNPPTPGRPSLVSADQESPVGRPHIVGGLDCLNGEPAPKWGLAKFPWALAGALMLAVMAASLLWSGDDSNKQIIMAGTEPVAAEPAPVPEAAPEAPAEALAEAEPPLPVLVKEAPAVPEPAQATVARIEPKVAAPPAAKQRARPSKPIKKVAVKKRPKATPAVRKKTIAPSLEMMSQADKEVALLAAVVSHAKITQEGPARLTLQWRQCGAAKSVAAARKCRVQLCAANENALECRGSRNTPAGSQP